MNMLGMKKNRIYFQKDQDSITAGANAAIEAALLSAV